MKKGALIYQQIIPIIGISENSNAYMQRVIMTADIELKKHATEYPTPKALILETITGEFSILIYRVHS